MANTAFKLFTDPQLAREALAALRASGYPAEAIGVLVREGSASETVVEHGGQAEGVGTLPDVGPVVAVGANVFGLAGATADADASAKLGAQFGLSPEALSTFYISLLRGSVIVAVEPREGLPDAQRVLRSVEPANVRTPVEYNEGFHLADRRTTTNSGDGQFSGDFRKY
ncbi:MAG: hypothetical protein ACYC3S_17485 [Chloroflexota bacterium]